MTDSIRARVEANRLWYHTIDVAPGVTTRGWFDLRSVVEKMPWPDVVGKRCLDVGTYDGFLAFEMERRGAAEVVAVDIEHHEDWDWPPRTRAHGADYLRHVAGNKGAGFEIAAAALASKATRRFVSVYDLRPEIVGVFDLVVCGDLLLHLRDPIGALEAIRTVCTGLLLSSEQVDVPLTIVHPRRAALHLNGDLAQWFVPNVVGHRHMLITAGFDVVDHTLFGIPFGPGHPPPSVGWRGKPRQIAERLLVRGAGLPTSAVLCRPAV